MKSKNNKRKYLTRFGGSIELIEHINPKVNETYTHDSNNENLSDSVHLSLNNYYLGDLQHFISCRAVTKCASRLGWW